MAAARWAGALAFPAMYVAPLHAWRGDLPRDDPRAVRARMALAAAATLLLSWVPTHLALRGGAAAAADAGLGAAAARLAAALGLRRAGLAAALAAPAALVAALFAGPLAMAWLDGARRPSLPPGGALLAARALAAAPLTEEAVFRGGLLSYLLARGAAPAACVALAPTLFGAAHLHHLRDLVARRGYPPAAAARVVAAQFCYTTAFGWLAAWLFLRTGHLAAPAAAHALCNLLGLPRFGAMARHRAARALLAATAGGVVAFAALLRPLTEPARFGWAPGEDYVAMVRAMARRG
jgi:prenyl protein peptidase